MRRPTISASPHISSPGPTHPVEARCTLLAPFPAPQVLGTVKDAALVTVGVLFLHEMVTRLQYIGYGVSLAG